MKPVRVSRCRGARVAAALLAAACLGLSLAGCGGGGGIPDAGTPDPGVRTRGGLSVSLVGGLPGEIAQVWVTVTGVALHADAQQPYSEGDASWVRLKPTTPLTVDLVALSAAGQSATLIAGQGIAVGRYAQLRLLLAPTDGVLLAAALSAGLAHNNEIARRLTDGSLQRLPLETFEAAPSLPVRGLAPEIVADTATSLSVQFGADLAVQALDAAGTAGGPQRWLLAGQPRGYDLARTGAVVGVVDVQNVCGQPTAPAVGCIDGLQAHVLGPSDDGSHLAWLRSVPVTPEGAIALYPLPPLAEVEVLVQGRHMQPFLMRQVAVDVAPLTAALPTLISDAGHLIRPVLQTASHAVQLASAAPPDAPQLPAVQTLAGELPRQRSAGSVDLWTGRWPVALEWGDGDWRHATWQADLGWAVQPVTPQEGAGGGRLLLPASASTQVQLGPVASAAQGAWGVPAAVPPAGVTPRSLTVSLTRGGVADRAALVVGDARGVLRVQDVSAALASGAPITLSLPGGVGLGVYQVGLRTWRAAAPADSLAWVRAPAAVDLRSAGTASLTLAVP